MGSCLFKKLMVIMDKLAVICIALGYSPDSSNFSFQTLILLIIKNQSKLLSKKKKQSQLWIDFLFGMTVKVDSSHQVNSQLYP